VGAVLAVLFSVVVGLPTFRLRGPYFSIATIGVSEAVRVIASGMEFTGGSSGLRMPSANFHFLSNYYGMAGLALLTVGLVAWVRVSAFGMALEAIRQDIDAAEALGIHSTRYKLLAHALSAALVGAGGGLFAMNFQYISARWSARCWGRCSSATCKSSCWPARHCETGTSSSTAGC
jgi:branched-chain amino acid transport system permease protein